MSTIMDQTILGVIDALRVEGMARIDRDFEESQARLDADHDLTMQCISLRYRVSMLESWVKLLLIALVAVAVVAVFLGMISQMLVCSGPRARPTVQGRRDGAIQGGSDSWATVSRVRWGGEYALDRRRDCGSGGLAIRGVFVGDYFGVLDTTRCRDLLPSLHGIGLIV